MAGSQSQRTLMPLMHDVSSVAGGVAPCVRGSGAACSLSLALAARAGVEEGPVVAHVPHLARSFWGCGEWGVGSGEVRGAWLKRALLATAASTATGGEMGAVEGLVAVAIFPSG